MPRLFSRLSIAIRNFCQPRANTHEPVLKQLAINMQIKRRICETKMFRLRRELYWKQCCKWYLVKGKTEL